MKVLALDLGTRTGWAFTPGTNITSVLTGYVDLKGGRYEGGGMRYLRFQQFLNAFPEKPEAIYFEEVRRHRGVDAAHVYGGLLAVLTSWCEDNNVAYKGVPVQTIKKRATGLGNAKKPLMIAAANKQGCLTNDDNEADAYWIARIALDDMGVSGPGAPQEDDIFD